MAEGCRLESGHGRLKACTARSELGRVRGGRRVWLESFLTAELAARKRF
jgi:hypothetical protein